MRFSPGRSSDGIAAPTLSHLEENDQRSRGQVWAISDGSFQRSPPDDDSNRHQPGDEHAVEQRLDRGQRAEQKAHERGELDISETQRLGLENQRAREGEDGEQEAGGDAGGQSRPPRVVEDARRQGEQHRGKDHAIEDEPVLEIEEEHLHQDQAEDAAQQQRPGRTELVAERREDQRRGDRRSPHLPGLRARLQFLQLREADRAPSHQPAAGRPHYSPGDCDEDVVHRGRVWRMASSGAGLPVQISNERAPWARRIPHPSAWRDHDASPQATTRPGTSASSGRLATKVRCAPSRATAAARADPPAPRTMTSAPRGSSATSASAARMPSTSVFEPIRRSPSLAIVLTALARSASASMPSRCSMTACLYGIVTLAPPASAERSLRMTSGNWSGGMSSIS